MLLNIEKIREVGDIPPMACSPSTRLFCCALNCRCHSPATSFVLVGDEDELDVVDEDEDAAEAAAAALFFLAELRLLLLLRRPLKNPALMDSTRLVLPTEESPNTLSLILAMGAADGISCSMYSSHRES